MSAWNQHDVAALSTILSAGALGDISAKDKGVTSSRGAGYAVLSGRARIIAFAQKQWSLGETLSYRRVVVVGKKGGSFDSMVATYSDGSRQTFTDTKFVYSCSDGAIDHFLLVASAPAR